MSWLRRLVDTLSLSRLQRDIDREIAFHIREREDDLRAGGVPDEVGLRFALGAARSGIVRQFVTQGLRISAVACACGLVLSIAFTQLLSGMLYGVTRFDRTTFSTVVFVVLTVATVASSVPAARAAFMQPLRALREE